MTYRLIICLLIYLLASRFNPLFANFEKYTNNPILTKDAGSWDSDIVWQPSILNPSNKYILFYSGYNGSRFQIGQADSYDAINWQKSVNNPIISRLALDNKDAHDPTAIYSNDQIELWYVGSDNGGSSNFQIYRAISNQNTDWINSPENPVLSPLGTWDAGGISAPHVLKVGNDYKMWYSGYSNGYWKIGYAESPDGIAWTPYINNPIIDLSNEGFIADGASVVYKNNSYQIYFHGKNNSVLMTESSDGHTNLSTPSIVLSPSQNYDNNYISAPSVLSLMSGSTLLYYSGLGNNNWSINLSFDGLLPTPYPTPTTIPTITPSPTSTPSPTPTPTPSTPKKVILIHGGGGSWNLDALLHCKLNNYRGDWKPWNFGDYDIYDSLEERLKTEGYNPIRFSYDWRRPTTETAGKLQDFIASNLDPNESAYIVAHSLGGLVSRAYLESTHEQSHIEKLLTVGTPHEGLSLAYPAWAGGEIWFDSIEMRLGLELLKATCKIHNSGRISDIIKTVFPSIQNILPIYDYLTAKNGYLTPVSDMHAQNNILPSDFSSPYHDTTLGTLSGRGYETLDTIQIEPPNKSDARKGYWEDGKPTGTNTYADGDGTVLFTSSQIPNATNTTLPLSHTDLITQPTGIDAIIQFLNGTPQVQPLLLRHSESDIHETEKQEALLIVTENAKAILITPNGEKISDTDGQITILDPDHKTYKLILVPKHIGWRTKPYHALVLQLFKNGKTETKEYKSGSWLPKYHTIHFEEGRKHQKQGSH